MKYRIGPTGFEFEGTPQEIACAQAAMTKAQIEDPRRSPSAWFRLIEEICEKITKGEIIPKPDDYIEHGDIEQVPAKRRGRPVGTGHSKGGTRQAGG